MTPEQAWQQIEEACFEGMGVLLSLYEHGLIPPAALPRVAGIVARWREAAPIARAKIAAVEAREVIDNARSV